MPLIPLASAGNFLHIYDFRVKQGEIAQFIEKFNRFDYSPDNPMHKSPAQVRDGVLVQDVTDAHRFWLIAEWASVEEHARIRKVLVEMKPDFIAHIEGGSFVPAYGEVVSSTPQDILDAAKAGA
jgi:hypothetical protein